MSLQVPEGTDSGARPEAGLRLRWSEGASVILQLSQEEESFFLEFSIQGHKHLVWASK